MRDYPADISEICVRRRYDGPTPCFWPDCTCDLSPNVPWYRDQELYALIRNYVAAIGVVIVFAAFVYWI